MSVKKVAPWAAAAITVLALSGCGQGGEITLPTASGSVALPTPSRTVERPTPSRTIEQPTPTRTEESPSTEAPTSEPTSEAPTPSSTLTQSSSTPTPEETTPEPEETTAPPEETPTETPTQESETPTPETSEPIESETPSETPSETETSESASASAPASASAAASADESESNPTALWLGLGALLAAAAALALFLITGSRRKKWDERLEVERAQGVWVADQLVPALTDPATPADQVAQHWAAAQPTLDQLDANVTELITEAPDEKRAMTARSIATALTQVRSSAAAHVALVGSGTADGAALGTSAAALVTARNQLSTTLTPTEG